MVVSGKNKMNEKKYKLINDIEFSIDVQGTLVYAMLDTTKQFKPYIKNDSSFHVGIIIHWKKHMRHMSIYFAASDMGVKELKKMRRVVIKYEPSEELIHMLRAAAIKIAIQWHEEGTILANEKIIRAIYKSHAKQRSKK